MIEIKFPRYALAVCNQVGRTLGMASAYTPAQRAVAVVMRNVYAAHGYDPETCACLVADADRECSFVLTARGDKGAAGGVVQWHNARRQAIKEHTRIDVWTASAADQAHAVVAEMTEQWSVYRHVDPALRAAKTIQAKNAVLVALYEQSGSQARDIARQNAMAVYWLAQFSGAVS